MKQSCFVDGCLESIQFCCECQDPSILICDSHLCKHFDQNSHVPKRIKFEAINAEARVNLRKGLNSLSQSLKFKISKAISRKKKKQKKLFKELKVVDQKYQEKLDKVYSKYSTSEDIKQNLKNEYGSLNQAFKLLTSRALRRKEKRQKRIIEELRQINQNYQDCLNEPYSKYFLIRSFLLTSMAEERIRISENPALSLNSECSTTDINLELYKVGFKSVEIANSLAEHANSLKILGNLFSGLNFYLKARKVRKQISSNFDSSYVDLLINIAGLYTAIGALIKLKEIETKTEGSLYDIAGITIEELNVSFSSLVDNALVYYFEATLLQLKLEIDTIAINKNLKAIETIYFVLSTHDKSSSSYLRKSLEILGQVTRIEKRDMALVLLRISDYYYDLHKREEALVFCKNAAKILKSTPNDILYRQAIFKMGIMFFNFDLIKQAKSLYKTCLELEKEYNDEDKTNEIIILFNIAKTYQIQGNFEKSISKLWKGIGIYRQYQIKPDIFYMRNLYKIGFLYKELNNYEEAVRIFKKCFKIQNDVLYEENSFNIIFVLSRIAHIYSVRGENLKSKNCYNKLIVMIKERISNFWLLQNNLIHIELYKSLKINQGDTNLTSVVYRSIISNNLMRISELFLDILGNYDFSAMNENLQDFFTVLIEFERKFLGISWLLDTIKSSTRIFKLYRDFIVSIPHYKTLIRSYDEMIIICQIISLMNKQFLILYSILEGITYYKKEDLEILLEFNIWWIDFYLNNQTNFRTLILKYKETISNTLDLSIEIIKFFGKEQNEDKKSSVLFFIQGIIFSEMNKYNHSYMFLSECLKFEINL